MAGGVTAALGIWVLSGLVSWVPHPWAVAVVAGAAVLCVLRDVGLLDLRLPQNARQVPSDVLSRLPWRAAAQFGFELGTGMRTFVTTAAPYVLAVALLFTVEHAWQALAAGVGFGLGRLLMPLARYLSPSGAEWDTALATRRYVLVVVSIAAAIAITIVSWTG